MKVAAAAALLVATLLAGGGSASSLPTRHEAKVRTFAVLLAVTEQRPDVADATHAAITVVGCERRSYGWRCTGSLAPVAFSGIDGSTCRYVAIVFRHATRLSAGDCA